MYLLFDPEFFSPRIYNEDARAKVWKYVHLRLLIEALFVIAEKQEYKNIYQQGPGLVNQVITKQWNSLEL